MGRTSLKTMQKKLFDKILVRIRELYGKPEGVVPLHAPIFPGKEREYLADCIDSTYVSSVGKYVERFEEMTSEFTGAKHAVATVNGTAALHMALMVAGVRPGDEVVTQAVSFAATANAVAHAGAEPVFVDSDPGNLGMSHEALERFFAESCRRDGESLVNIKSGRRVAACVPMHVFGHPVRIDEISALCKEHCVALVEDSAESLGSTFNGRHTGTFGDLGIFSYNGNKTVTCGGGGMIVTNDPGLAARAKHLTTTAKLPHKWEYFHDQVGYNYRLPNINAALGCAQMEKLPEILADKQRLAESYREFFNEIEIPFIFAPENCHSNYWLNTILLKDRAQRDEFLEYANAKGVMARAMWTLLSKLPMYEHCQSDGLKTAQNLEDRLVNIPSGARI